MDYIRIRFNGKLSSVFVVLIQFLDKYILRLQKKVSNFVSKLL